MAKKKEAPSTEDDASSGKSDQGKSNNGATRDESKDQDGLALFEQHRAEVRKAAEGLKEFKVSKSSLGDLRKLYAAWARHDRLVGDIVFPALHDADVERDRVDQVLVEHDLVSLLLRELAQRQSDEHLFPAGVRVAVQMIERLLEAASQADDGLVAKAVSNGMDLDDVKRDLREIVADARFKAEDMSFEPRPRYLRGTGTRSHSKEIDDMRGQDRERDEYGRFVSDDDRGHGQQQRGQRGGYSRQGDHDQERDSRGRFMSEDDDRRYSSRGRQRDDDDHYGRSQSSSRGGYRGGRSEDYGQRGQRRTGGWFGDSEGHSEASRRGWENPDHGESGWFGDREGHRQAATRGWDNPDHGRSGWFGDSEGHSEASRRGWESRRSSSSRYEPDDYEMRRSRRRYED